MIDSNSAENLWQSYLQSINASPEATKKTYTAWHFCDNENDANELADLVKAGRKRATASSFWTYEHEQEPLPQVGDYSVITDWQGKAQCIICTTSIKIVPFNKVTPEFAQAEGEGDGSLAYWRKTHWAFFTRELDSFGKQPDETMLVVCEEFKVVYIAEVS